MFHVKHFDALIIFFKKRANYNKQKDGKNGVYAVCKIVKHQLYHPSNIHCYRN